MNRTYQHVSVMVNGRRAKNETRDIRGHFLPRVMLDHFPFTSCRLWVSWCPFLRKKQLGMRNPSRTNLKRSAHEFVLGIDLEIEP